MIKKKYATETLRHSTSHVLAAAVLDMFPEAKFGIGPAIENGFYYDFDLPRTLIPEDLPLLEEKMRAIIKAGHNFEEAKISASVAKDDFKKLGQTYKLELIDDLEKENEQICIYKAGTFVDLCAGPHVASTKDITPEAFKLTKISGAYWKGDEKNKQLQRIYGVVFESKKELEEYLRQMEEAKRRDHRKLGEELDLFTFSDLVGAGLPLFTPKGTIIRNELKNELLRISKKYKMLQVTIPHLAKIELYKKSGHAEKFEKELFKVISHYGQEFVLKPVNCPHHTQIYASKQRSYRDLPIRYMESTMMYRDEKPGEIGGLTRVRAIDVDDGHIFCTVDQLKDECKNISNIIAEFYTSLGMYGQHWVSLSVRDPKTPEKYIGEESDWSKAEKMLKEISDELNLKAKRMEGEAALYGPKLDYMFKDALGNVRQLATIQVDFAMPKRFELFYMDKNGKKVPPVMIHRAILGSYERFMAILIEHYAGAFPLWLSPVQVAVIPVSEKFSSYAEKVNSLLLEKDIRAEIDATNESLGKRIRNGEKQKIPYMLIVGEKEMEAKSVAVRHRDKGDEGMIKLEDFAERIKKQIEEKK